MMLALGDICLAAGYGGDLNLAKARSEEVNNIVDSELLFLKVLLSGLSLG